MNIYTDIVQPFIQTARAIVHWPAKPSEVTWFPRGEREPEDCRFVAWRDPNFFEWRVGRLDGMIKEWWGATWVHVQAQQGADKWLRWDSIPWVQ